MSLTRRGLLTLAGVAAAAAGCGRASDGPGTGRLLTSKALPARFTAPLPIPAIARPVRVTADADHYVLTQKAADVSLLPGRTTRIWGYDGTFPGPTLRVRAGRPAVVTMRNELPVPTSTHLHGGVTPPDSDGFPTDLTVPRGYSPAPPTARQVHDVSRDYRYPNNQRAATLWYHDHRMDFTGPQVWRGLLGLYQITDPREEALPLPRDDRDLPLMICDRAFEEDGSFAYPSHDMAMHRPGARGQFVTGVFGDVILVNGAPWPRHEVDAARYRLRLVNASNARRYRLALEAGGKRLPMIQIGSDDGLLPAPITHTEIIVTPGERYDVVVDFAALPIGTEVTLVNDFGIGTTAEVMRFAVARKAADDSRVPDRLVPAAEPPLTTADAVTERQFDFRYDEGRWTVNRQLYDPAGSLATPRLDTVELWRFTSDFHHPVHVHLAHFQVLSRSGRSPEPWETGWKDTVDVRPYETVEVLAKFAGHRGKYMLHCHNLEHEDMAMMANFDVI
ncbi:multicopper oxidase domain-containing protein [Actinoplanes sp. NPDC051470]|uniref:multicopper oxidase family protein n=1 Tax=Actinoplanes sp. NPDC051470 TaxID=3157224 RepID=UPI0034463855